VTTTEPTLRWQPLATLVLSIAGLGIATYLTITHFDKVALSVPTPGPSTAPR
jgi:hypothetical protein